MEIRLITPAGEVRAEQVSRLPDLLAGGEGVVWVDIPVCDQPAMRVLTEVFGFHPHAVRDSAQRNRVPKVHVYADHAFVVLHSPELGAAGHVHYVELDQFIGPGYLVTVHGPLNPAVDTKVSLQETGAVLRRIEAGRFKPQSSHELSYAVVGALTRRLEEFIERQTQSVWLLEQRVTSGHLGDPEQFLDQMFRARHGLIAARTMGALGREIYGRLAVIGRGVPPSARPMLEDTVDQFSRIYALADSQKDYLQGVIEFYRTRSDTKMTVAAERLAVIAVVTLPITALSSILGMNIIVNDQTDFPLLAVVLTAMSIMSATLLAWAKRQGWW
ncbi:magnesium transporter CorA family protein [Actinoplanes sp. NPDC051861]|uniref:magnesium transporter CorA family protein n=1 Tax=Actinoplanes sp. NPDC051861 TaxID=3155170 RepID=UPI0034381E24